MTRLLEAAATSSCRLDRLHSPERPRPFAGCASPRPWSSGAGDGRSRSRGDRARILRSERIEPGDSADLGVPAPPFRPSLPTERAVRQVADTVGEFVRRRASRFSLANRPQLAQVPAKRPPAGIRQQSLMTPCVTRNDENTIVPGWRSLYGSSSGAAPRLPPSFRGGGSCRHWDGLFSEQYPCRVEVRRGSLGRSSFSPVSPPFRLRVSHHLDHAPFPHPAHRTRRA